MGLIGPTSACAVRIGGVGWAAQAPLEYAEIVLINVAVAIEIG